MKLINVSLITLLVSFVSVKAPLAFAEETKPSASFDREFTLGLSLPHQGFGGDFDGERFYTNGVSAIVVPEVDPAFGIGVSGGIKSRVQENLALGIDVALNTARHNVTWAGEPGKAESFHLDFDFKLYFNVRRPAQPFVLGGYSISSLRVDDGYLSATETKDVTFTGHGFHLGAGLNYYLTPQVSLNGSLRHRWLTFDEVNYGSRSTLNPSLKSTAMDFSLGAAYHFNLH